MIKLVLLIGGFSLLIFQQYILPIPVQIQYIFFLTGIVILGVPHGAADLLIATQNAADDKKSFSKLYFFINYLSRLLLFATILWFFPLPGNLLFILFAAYHFGETDLHKFNTNSFIGKFFITSYGLVILSVILLHNFQEIRPLFQLFSSGIKYAAVIDFIGLHTNHITLLFGLLFLISSILYFSTTKSNKILQKQFFIHFLLILVILYNLPMIVGFTFYFVVWHSFLSLKNIVNYLRRDNVFSAAVIIKQILIYSVLALAGIAVFGLTGFMFINLNSIIGYIFLSLAVLTAPHMQIMHNMYTSIRSRKNIISNLPAL